MDALAGKLIAMLIFFIGTLVATLTPVLLRRKATGGRNDGAKSRLMRILDCCNSVAGGVFLATCFVALFPFVRHSFAEATEAASIHEHYPFAEFSLLAGFFMIVFIEIIVTAREESHGDHSHASSSLQEEESLISDSDNTRQSVGHDHHGGHNHSHLTSSKSLLHTVLLVLTLGIHTLFEGMSIGLINDISVMVSLVTSIFIHEVCCAIALGINMSQQKMTLCAATTVCVTFSIMMPLGIAVGLGLGQLTGAVGLIITAIIQGLATGTFVYVIFMEIIPSILKVQNSVLQVVLMLIGCLSMTLVITFTHHHGSKHSSQDLHNMATNISVVSKLP